MRTSRWPLAAGGFVAVAVCVSPSDVQTSWIGVLAIPATIIAGRQARRLRGTRAFATRLMLFASLMVNLLAALLRSLLPTPPVFLLEASLWRTIGVLIGVVFAAFVIRSEHLSADQGQPGGAGGPVLRRAIRADIATLLESFAAAAALGLLVWVLVVEPWGAREHFGAPVAYPALWFVLDTAVSGAAIRAWRRAGSQVGPHLWLVLMFLAASGADAAMMAAGVTGSSLLWTITCLGYTAGMMFLVMMEVDSQFGVAAVPAGTAALVPQGRHLVGLSSLALPVVLVPFLPSTITVTDSVVRAALIAATFGLVLARTVYGGLQLVRAEDDAQWRAGHDSLTGLMSRYAFLSELTRRLAGVGPADTTALLFIDLDGFKEVNDTRGHDVGDALLVEVASRVSTVAEHHSVARLGGDEFVVLLGGPGLGEAQIRLVAERIAASLAEPVGQPSRAAGCSITASIGGCLARGAVGCDELLAAADEVMYTVKHHGKNAVAWREIAAPSARHFHPEELPRQYRPDDSPSPLQQQSGSSSESSTRC